MSAYNLDKMLTASFRGVEFLTEGNNESGGQKHVIHEYVNSNRRSVEGLGVNQPLFTITALVHGDNFVEHKKQLIRAMKQNGYGQYVHQFDGKKRVFPTGYKVVDNEKKLGQAVLTLSFAEVPTSLANPNALPTSLDVDASDVREAAEEVSKEAEAVVASTWSVLVNAFKGGYAAAQDTLGGVRDGFQSAVNVVNTTADSITEYQAEIDAFTRELNQLIATPSVLASRLTGLQTSLGNLVESPQQMWDIQKALFDRLLGDTPPNATGTVLAQRQLNDAAVTTWQQATNIAEMFTALSEFDFTTSLDLIDAEAEMVLVFNTFMEDDSIRQQITQPLREKLDKLNATSQAYLNLQATQTPNTFTVTVTPTPLAELLYRYYGNSDNMEDIISLNNIVDVAEVSGEITLVTVNDNTA